MAAVHRLSAVQRRDGIVSAAIGLFAERGFRGVTTRELASAVGVTEPVLYQHFPSKRDLYRAIIEHKIAQTAELKARFHELCETATAAEPFFRQMADLVVDWHHADPTFMRLMLQAGLDGHELRDMMHERMMTDYFSQISATISRLGQRETFRLTNPAVAAYSFVSMIHHHCLDRLLFAHPLGPMSNEELLPAMVDIFLHGLKENQ
jgi:AcrR family transcriptional regulator